MNTFAKLFESSKVERAIFFHQGSVNTGDMWDLIEDDDQEFVTIEDIATHDGDTPKEFMLHFIGEGPNDKAWDKFVKYIEKKCKKCEFERFVP